MEFKYDFSQGRSRIIYKIGRDAIPDRNAFSMLQMENSHFLPVSLEKEGEDFFFCYDIAGTVNFMAWRDSANEESLSRMNEKIRAVLYLVLQRGFPAEEILLRESAFYIEEGTGNVRFIGLPLADTGSRMEIFKESFDWRVAYMKSRTEEKTVPFAGTDVLESAPDSGFAPEEWDGRKPGSTPSDAEGPDRLTPNTDKTEAHGPDRFTLNTDKAEAHGPDRLTPNTDKAEAHGPDRLTPNTDKAEAHSPDRLTSNTDETQTEKPDSDEKTAADGTAKAQSGKTEKPLTLKKNVQDMPAQEKSGAEDVPYRLRLRRERTGEWIEIRQDEAIIGRRAQTSGVTISDNPAISREHCEVRRTRDGFEIRDLRSANYTFLDGRRVTSEAWTPMLRKGSLRIADEEFDYDVAKSTRFYEEQAAADIV